MKIKLLPGLLSALIAATLSLVSFAQSPKPVAYTTPPKLTIAKLKPTETEIFDVRGKVTFTITAANSDDTLAGIMNYTVPDEARQKIASLTGKALGSIPSTITRKDVVAGFQKGTGGPVINLEIGAMDIDVAGAKLYFNRITLDVNGRDAGNYPKFTNEEMEAMFTVWARQIGSGRGRRGIIAAVNRRIAGEDDQ